MQHSNLAAGNRLMLAVLDLRGQEATIEVSIRRDTVECWSQNRCCGVFVRDQLRVWLAAPFGCYAVDELMLAQTRIGVSLLIDGQIPWQPLAPHILNSLRERI